MLAAGLVVRQSSFVDVSLIGVPTDVGASVVGCRLGPGALRLAGIQEALERFGATVKDCGDVSGPANPMAPPVDGYRHLPEVVKWNEALFDAVYGQVSMGRMPIMLGGDHCLAIGSVSAVARHCREQGRPMRLLWFDAHADYNTASITPSGNMHGMPVAVLKGFLNAKDEAQGRPVGVAIDKRGALLVADDVGNVIWRVTSAN